jgi:hypothetical protein
VAAGFNQLQIGLRNIVAKEEPRAKGPGIVAAHESIGIPHVIRFENHNCSWLTGVQTLSNFLGIFRRSLGIQNQGLASGVNASGRRQRLPVETRLPKRIYKPPYPQAVSHVPHLNPWRRFVVHLDAFHVTGQEAGVTAISWPAIPRFASS